MKTDSERIAELEERVRQLEARPVYVPMQPYGPSLPSNPWETLPFWHPYYQVTCGTAYSGHNQ